MRGTVAKQLRRQADDLEVRGTPDHRRKYKQLKEGYYGRTAKQRTDKRGANSSR